MFQEDHNFVYLSENLRVPKNLYEHVAEIADYKKYVSAMLMILFDRATLATHCLQGRKNSFVGEESHKPSLPPEILKSLMGKKIFQPMVKKKNPFSHNNIIIFSRSCCGQVLCGQ